MGNCLNCKKDVSNDIKNFTIKNLECFVSAKIENIAKIETDGIVLPMGPGFSFVKDTYKIPKLIKGPLQAAIKKEMAKTTDNKNQYIRALRLDDNKDKRWFLCYEMPEVTQDNYKSVLKKLTKEIMSECER